jgi:hypothetical protein
MLGSGSNLGVCTALLDNPILPASQLATMIYILVTYHIILVILIFKAERKGFSLPIGLALLTHLACMAAVVGLGMGRHYIPFFGIIRYFIPGIAPFEAKWLFSHEKKMEKDSLTSMPVEVRPSAPFAPPPASNAAVLSATAEDYKEWLSYLATRKPSSIKRGLTLDQEYGQWLAARAPRKIAPGPD